MVWFVVIEIFSTLLEWVRLGRRSAAGKKDLEILLLRQQLRGAVDPVGASEECLDKLLIFSEDHLRRVMRDYIAYYNTARSSSKDLTRTSLSPDHFRMPTVLYDGGTALGGIIHDYYREVA